MATTTDSDPISERDDLFEFFCTSVATPELFAADNVIIGGKLLPSWNSLPPPPQPKMARAHVRNLSAEFALRRTSSLDINNIPNFSKPDHCRSSSLGDLPRGGVLGGGKKTRECSKLKRVSDPEPRRPLQQAKGRPRWYALVFAPVGINPSGMKLKDIRFRQQRRQEAAEIPSEWGPWKLLRSLSCRGIEAVIAP